MIVPFPGPSESPALDPFDQFIAAYPRKQQIGTARGRWIWALAKVDNNHQTIIDGAARAAAYYMKEGTELRFIPLPYKWLDAEGWLDQYELPKAPPEPPNAARDRIVAKMRESAAGGSRFAQDWLRREGLDP